MKSGSARSRLDDEQERTRDVRRALDQSVDDRQDVGSGREADVNNHDNDRSVNDGL
jgi:hypothetical protein